MLTCRNSNSSEKIVELLLKENLNINEQDLYG